MQVITRAVLLIKRRQGRLIRQGHMHMLRLTAANVLSKVLEAPDLDTLAAAQFSFPFGEDFPHRPSEKSTALFPRLLLSFHNVSLLQMFLTTERMQYI